MGVLLLKETEVCEYTQIRRSEAGLFLIVHLASDLRFDC